LGVQDFLGKCELTLHIKDLIPDKEYATPLTLNNTESGSLHIRYKWIKKHSGNSLEGDFSSSSGHLTAHIDTDHTVHNKFGKVFKPCLPSSFELVASNNNPSEPSHLGVFVEPGTQQVMTIMYNRVQNNSFEKSAEAFIGSYFKGLKQDAEETFGSYQLVYQMKDCTTFFNGNGKYKKVFEHSAKATVNGKIMQIVGLSCNADDDLMLNFILMSPGQSNVTQEQLTLLWDVAAKTDAFM